MTEANGDGIPPPPPPLPPEPPPQTDVMGRQVWDKNFYAQRALLRLYEEGSSQFGSLSDAGSSARQKRPRTGDTASLASSAKSRAEPGEKRPLEKRTEEVPLEAELGKFRTVTPHTPQAQQGGYWCDVCNCLIKDSQAYLDHINGRRHNRLLGMSMRVERVDSSRVKNHLKEIKVEREKEAREQELSTNLENTKEMMQQDLQRLAQISEEEKKRKKERKERKKRKKLEAQEAASRDSS